MGLFHFSWRSHRYPEDRRTRQSFQYAI